jgi:hypothetical protein
MFGAAPAFTTFARRSSAALVALALLGSASVEAALVTVSPGQSLVLSETNSGDNNSGNPATHNTSDLTGLMGSASYNYANGFTSQQTTNYATTSYGFYDDFVFTVGSNQADSITSTISLGSGTGISNLQVRLYDFTANGGAVPLLATPVTGSAFDAWSTPVSYAPGVTGTIAVLNPTTLAAGTYVLEVRGTATGTGGGSYAGVLNVTPVPLPAGLPLLLSGVGALGGLLRRRRAA